MPAMSNSLLHVAVGVILDHRQQILIALRPQNTHQGGLWEFPGGKVETGETVQQALNRELFEELGLTVDVCSPLIEVRHQYSEKIVFLDVWWVEQFSGEPSGKEGQPFKWVSADALSTYPFPDANQQIVAAVQRALC
ncbi:MAG: 8-oxo-dGTP diphosphatase MutT [Oceanicoccus sp.]